VSVVPIDSLNTLPPGEFVEALKPLFEAARPLAEAVYAHRPYASYAQLIDVAESIASAMPFEQQVEVLAAHPRIGALSQTLSETSRREQSYGTQPSEAVLGDLVRLNREYEEHFGFRFVVFVNKRSRAEIVDVLRQRLTRSTQQELRAGLHDIFLIARDRLASST
jgi:2-oxo-4-hydroxy-4-carboxy--5-ureidoimidazoline (OHCU) decarboxylase